MPKLIDTVLPHHHSNKDKYYFFSGEYYSRYTSGKGTDKGYPKKILGNWDGLWKTFPGPYDIAMVSPDISNGNNNVSFSRKYYFFKGYEYVLYTPGKGIDEGYPKLISDGWNGLVNKAEDSSPSSEDSSPSYDAGFYDRDKGKYYFFKNKKYVRYTPNSGVDKGYPKDISEEWHRMPKGEEEKEGKKGFKPPYDAVVHSKTNSGIYYFFKGSDYVRYKKGKGIDGDYPQSTEYRWPGVWQLKPYSAFTLGSFTPEGPLFSIRLLENDKVITILPSKLTLTLIDTIHNNENEKGKKQNHFVGYTRIYRIDGIKPGTQQEATLQIDGEDIVLRVDKDKDGNDIDITTLPIKNAPLNSDFEPFSLAMGSCLDDALNIKRQIGTVEAMVSENPDMMIWNGDTSYYVGENLIHTKKSTGENNVEKRGDMEDPPHSMFLRMFKTRHHPSVTKAMCNIPAISTWDDHDFGFNNANSKSMSAGQIKDATEVFRTCWPNNYEINNYEPNEEEQHVLDKPINHSLRYGQTEIFLPDTRSYRKPRLKGVDDKIDSLIDFIGNKHLGEILGKDQVDSLIESMENSDAALKILVLSSQLIPERIDDNEGFSMVAPGERKRLLDAFKKDTFSGRVLVLSGDVHYSELSYDGNTSENPKIVEVTSSPMLLRSGEKAEKPKKLKEEPKTRIWSAKGNTYAMLNVSYDKKNHPIVKIEMRNDKGETVEIASKYGGTGADWEKANAIWDTKSSLEQLS